MCSFEFSYITHENRTIYCIALVFHPGRSLLIVGNSLQPALPALHVAPERFALIVHVMAVCLASLSPVSSWVGLQIGEI